jgi:Mg2+ and Co2+ transporter CorA
VLLIIGNRKPVLDQDDPRTHQHFFKFGNTTEEFLVFFIVTRVEIAPDEVTDELLNSDQPVWLHLNFSNTRVMRWLQRTKIVPAELADSVLNDTSELSTNAITELSQGALFHLKDFSLDFGQESKSNNLDFESFWCYLTPTLLITGRQHPLKTLDQTKFQLLKGRISPNSVQELFH